MSKMQRIYIGGLRGSEAPLSYFDRLNRHSVYSVSEIDSAHLFSVSVSEKNMGMQEACLKDIQESCLTRAEMIGAETSKANSVADAIYSASVAEKIAQEGQLVLHLDTEDSGTKAEAILIVVETDKEQINVCLDDVVRMRILGIAQAIGLMLYAMEVKVGS